MSILFKALNKAAGDYRAKKAPIVIPLIKMPPAFDTKKRFRVALAVIFAVAFLLSLVTYYTEPEHTVDEAITAQTSLPKPVQVSINKNGISLPASALEEVEDQIEQTHVLKTAPPKISRVSITHSNVALKREFEKASHAIESGAWDKALAIYQKVLERDPQNKQAMAGKIFVLGLRGHDEDLIALEQFSIDTPYNPKIHAARARILAKQKNIMESLAAWKRAYKLAPRNKDFGLGLAVTLDRLGRNEEALQLYKRLPKPLPIDVQRRLNFLNAQKLVLTMTDMN